MKRTVRKLISVLLCTLLCLSALSLCASALGETCQVICSHDNALQHGWYRVVFYAHDTYEVRPNPDNAYNPLISFGNPADGFAPFEGDIELERGEYIQIDYFPESGYRLAYLNAIYVTEGESGSTPQKANLTVVSSASNTYVLETPTNIGAYSVRIDPVFRALPAPPVWSWNDDHTAATATFTLDDDDVQTVTDEAPRTNEISAADCENDRVVTYTATVEFDGVTYSDTTERIPVAGTATGHTYGQPVWSWNDDHTAATAAFTCGCGDVQSVTDEAPAMREISAATATEDQVVRFTASVTFNGQSFTDETDDVTVEGTATGTQDDPATPEDPSQNEEPAQDAQLCSWCQEDHSGSFLQRIVGFFHSVLYFWAHLFGLR